MTKSLTATFRMVTLLMLVAFGTLLPSVVAAEDDLAIVEMADAPIDALSRLPQEHYTSGGPYYVIRLSKRNTTPAPLDAHDTFTPVGFLCLDNSGNLIVDKAENITYANHSNYHYVWNIFSATASEHHKVGFYNPSVGKYLSATGTSGSVTSTADIAATNYFTAKSYADHFVEYVEVKGDYPAGVAEADKEKQYTDSHSQTWSVYKKHVDHYDYSKHFFHLQNTNNKIFCTQSGENYTLSIVNEGGSTHNTEGATSPYYNNYACDGNKDQFVFEIFSVEVASATDIIYEFHATDTNSGATWNFEINGKSATNALALSAIPTAFKDDYKGLNGEDLYMLRYYKNFTEGDNTAAGYVAPGAAIGGTQYPRVKINCEANFPFPISNDVSFDNANNDLNFLTLSVNAADEKNQEGHYIGYEGDQYATHGHTAADIHKVKTNFRRHVYTGLFWTITKSHTGVSNPNSVRLHTFFEGLSLMQANVHDSQTDGLYSLVPQNVEDIAHDDCDHEIFQVIPNGTGFSLVLKSNHNLIAQTSANNNFGLGAKPTTGTSDENLQACRMYAPKANDLINILTNSRVNRNIGGMNFSDDDAWGFYYMADSYLQGVEWRKEHKTMVLVDNGVNDWSDWGESMYRFRLQSLHYSMLLGTAYNNFDTKKQYRIELFDENSGDTDHDNKMLSSFETYMNEHATEIAGAGMKTTEVTTSALLSGSAKSAPSYWRIMPTEAGVTPENGEEMQVAFYNSNVGAFLKKTDDGVTFDAVKSFELSNVTDDNRFYIKQEGTSDQWVILNDLSTHTGVHKLSVVRGDETFGEGATDSPDAFYEDNDHTKKLKPVNTLYWSRHYEHGQNIQRYVYNTEHAAHHGRWMFTPIESYPMTISSVGCSSLCLPYPVSISGARVYKATGCSVETDETKLNKGIISSVTLEEISGSPVKLPASTPVVLKGTAGAAVSITVLNENVEAITGNQFVAVNAQWGDKNSATEMVAGRAYFGLGNRANTGVGFYPILSTTGKTYLPANKAYLNSSFADPGNKLPQAETQVSAAKGAGAVLFRFVDDNGTVTEINSVTGETSVRPADGVYYDLSGRRVATPGKGIYVNSNGKKFIVK